MSALLHRTRSLLNETDDDEIDLTNLIDPLVLLCGLLMILMPQLTDLRTRETQLVPADGSPLQSPSEQTPLLVLSHDGSLFWSDEPLSMSQLIDRLQQLPPRSRVLLAGDARASYGDSLKLRALLQDHGVQVMELTTPRQSSESVSVSSVVPSAVSSME